MARYCKMSTTIDVLDLTEVFLDAFSQGRQILIKDHSILPEMHIRIFDDIFLVENVTNGRKRQLLTIRKL